MSRRLRELLGRLERIRQALPDPPPAPARTVPLHLVEVAPGRIAPWAPTHALRTIRDEYWLKRLPDQSAEEFERLVIEEFVSGRVFVFGPYREGDGLDYETLSDEELRMIGGEPPAMTYAEMAESGRAKSESFDGSASCAAMQASPRELPLPVSEEEQLGQVGAASVAAVDRRAEDPAPKIWEIYRDRGPLSR